MGGVREGGRKRVLNLGVEFILILEEALVEYLVEPVPRPDLVPVKNGKCDMCGENGELWHMRKRKKGLA